MKYYHSMILYQILIVDEILGMHYLKQTESMHLMQIKLQIFWKDLVNFYL